MGIFYCLVARGNVVLAESSAAATATNASSLARQVLEKTLQAAKDNSNASYSHDRCIFHVKRTDGLTVLCMADDAFGRNYYYLPFFFSCFHDFYFYWIFAGRGDLILEPSPTLH